MGKPRRIPLLTNSAESELYVVICLCLPWDDKVDSKHTRWEREFFRLAYCPFRGQNTALDGRNRQNRLAAVK